MAVCAVIRNPDAVLLEGGSQRGGILQGLLLQLQEFLSLREFKGERHRGNGIDMRTALLAGEDAFIELLAELFIVGDNHGAARTAKGLMRGKRDHVGNANRRGANFRGDKTGNVRNICQQVSADALRDLFEFFPIRNPGVG